MRAVRILIFILVVVGLIWLIVALFQKVISNGNTTTPSTTTQSLASYSDTSAAVSMYVDGPVVANQEHDAVRITVDQNQSSIEVIKGYDDQVVAQRSYPNTQASYLEFLSALDTAGFTKGKTDPTLQNDLGACPFGNRYVYTMRDSSKEILHFWTTNCSGTRGTYGGRADLTRELFMRQIPDADLTTLTNNIAL